MSGEPNPFHQRVLFFGRELHVPDDEAEWKKMCDYLAQKKCVVEDLSICFTFIGDYSDEFHVSVESAVSHLEKALKKNDTIARLKIEWDQDLDTENCLTPAIMALKSNTSVKELILDEHHLSPRNSAVEALCSVLKMTKTLKVLSIALEGGDFSRTYTAIADLSKGLERNTSLKEVTLDLDSAIPRELDRLSVALKKNQAVESYKLHVNNFDWQIDVIDVTSILRAVENSACVKTFEIISFDYLRFFPGTILCFLEHNRVLQDLKLTLSSEEDLRGLANGLKLNRSLSGLNVRLTKHFELSLVDTLRIILEGLANNASGLKSLHLDIHQEVFLEAADGAVSKARTLLQRCQTLESLAIHKGYDDDNDVFSWVYLSEIVFPVLREGSTSIKALELRGYLCTDVFAETVSLLSAERCSLRNLTLCATELSQDDFDAIVRAQRSNPSLEELTVEVGLFVDEDGRDLEQCNIEELLNTLKETTCFRKLHLKHFPISSSGASKLAKVLKDDNTSLESLSLINCTLNDDAVVYLGEMLPSNSSLKSVHLDWKDFGERGVQALVAGLEKNTSVEDFSGIPNQFPLEQKRAEYYTMMNKARRTTYLETENMKDNEWLKALERFDNCGNLSTVYFAVRTKPDFIRLRGEDSEENPQLALELNVSTETTQAVVPRGKRKRDEDYD